VKIISGKRMCRILEQRGWTLARINGAHMFIDTLRPVAGRSYRCMAIKI
jgi:predicted RNA binding protein YcfA (HicA-like mRNA interferase family)